MSQISHRTLLELMHRSDLRLVSLRFRHRRCIDRQLAALARMRLEIDRRSARWMGGGGQSIPQAGYDETEEQCWVDRLGRRRVERDGRLTIAVGGRVFTWAEGQGGEVKPRGDDRSWAGGEFLQPRRVLAEADVEAHGTAVFLGRPVHLVRATPLSYDSPYQYPTRRHPGAECYELVLDAERGVILREEVLLYGKALEVHEVTDIEFDPDFDDELFAFRAPDGSEPFVYPDDYASRAFMPLNEVSAVVGFDVLAPSGVDRAPQCRVHQERDGSKEVHLECLLLDANGVECPVGIRQWAGDPPDLPPAAMRKIKEDGYCEQGRAVVVERDGVWAVLQASSRLEMAPPGSPPPSPPPRPSAEQLIAWARDLMPVPSEPPPLVPIPVPAPRAPGAAGG